MSRDIILIDESQKENAEILGHYLTHKNETNTFLCTQKKNINACFCNNRILHVVKECLTFHKTRD